MKYTVEWLSKGFTHPVEVVYEDDSAARMMAIQLLAESTTERVSYQPERAKPVIRFDPPREN